MKRWEWFLCLPLGFLVREGKSSGCGRANSLHSRSTRAAHLVCDYYENNDAYANAWYLHISGAGSSALSPSSPTDPNSRAGLPADQNKPSNKKKEREKIRNRRARDGGGIPPDRSLYFKPQLRPHFCCRIQAACRFWPSSCRHGLEPTSPQNRPRSSPRRRHLHHHHHHHSRPSRPGSMSRNTRPKNSSAAQQSSWVCLLPELASSPSQP